MSLRPLSGRERAAYRELWAHAYVGPGAASLAVAMHERTGWPTFVVRGAAGETLHAGVRDPEGRLRDVRGVHDEEGFVEGFGGVVAEASPADLVLFEAGVRETMLSRARRDVGLLVDGLPGVDPWLARLEAFAAGLERLCVETGIYVREDTWGGIPVYEAYGDERGFEIGFDETGGARLSRVLR